jgi:histidine triad (HIT) family protein
MEDTIFMKIIRREIPAEIVYEDADTLAFLDVKPINLGHTLVVPKKFARNLLDVDGESLAAVMRTAQKIAVALRETGADGVNIGINNESAAGQLVFHFHVHVIPRFVSDGLEHWHGKECPLDEFKAIAAKLRKKLS